MASKPVVRFQFLRFLGAGLVAAAGNYASRFAFNLFMPFEPSVIAAYLVGTAIAYFILPRFVFQHRHDGALHQAWRFMVVNGVAISVAVGVSSIMARLVLPALSIQENAFAIAHLIGITAPTVTSYLGHKFFTYRHAHG